jgi:peptidyl-prolyl cis-trans isomerase C
VPRPAAAVIRVKIEVRVRRDIQTQDFMVKRSIALLTIGILAAVGCRQPADPIPAALVATANPAQTSAAQKPPGQTPPAQTPPATAMPPAPPGTQTPSAGQGAKPAPGTQPPANVKPMPAELPEVLARVNGEEVKKADFDAMIKNAEIGMGRSIPVERRDEAYRAALDQLITFTVLRQEANARHLEVTDAEIDERMAGMRKAFPTEEAFKKALTDRSLSLERLRSDTQSNLMIDKLVQGEIASVPATTDEEAQTFYTQNPERFKQGETVRASHILIKVDPKADEAAKAKARAEADALLKQAKAGEDFAKLAQARSQDETSAPNGGDLNYFSRGRMVPPFEQVAFALQPGDISDVVTTQFGFHIIKVTDRKPAAAVPLEQVKDQLKVMLQNQKKRQRAESFIATLRQKSKIEVLV